MTKSLCYENQNESYLLKYTIIQKPTKEELPQKGLYFTLSTFIYKLFVFYIVVIDLMIIDYFQLILFGN